MLVPIPSLLGWCAVLSISALLVVHPGRQRPGEAATPRLEALVEGEETSSGVETTQRCAKPSNPPHQAQGRLGPNPVKTMKTWGFQRELPLVGLWCLSPQ